VGDVLEVAFQSCQKPDVVLGLHVEPSKILAQVLEGIVDAAVDLHEALDSWCLQLLIEGAQSCVSLTPVIKLCQRTISLDTISTLYLKTRNSAIANRSSVSCGHYTSKASIDTVAT